MRERRYDDKEVALILSQAAKNQVGARDSSSVEGVTLSELVRIAQEVGIDAGQIETAARELDNRRLDRTAPKSNAVLFEQTLAGEISDDVWDRWVTEVQSFSGSAGTAKVDGGVREWRSGGDWESVTLSSTTRNGRTRLKLMADASGAAAMLGVFGFVLGMFFSMSPLITNAKLHGALTPVFTLLLTVLAVGISVVATTSVVRNYRRKLSPRVSLLMDRLVAIQEKEEVLQIPSDVESRLSSIAPSEVAADPIQQRIQS